jgi:flagellar protein FlaG
MDVRGVDVSHTITGGAEIATAPVLRAGSNQTKRAAAEDSKVSHEKITHIMQDQLDSMNVSLKYFTYGDSGKRIAIAVVNTTTGEVVREIPAKELRALYAKMNELVGMILNREI